MYQPLGVPVAGGNALVEGWIPPQFDKGYQYILLSAGASGYHGNRIINESVTGSWPNITATGTINVPGSPFHGKTVRLINNERRFLRPGTLPGEMQQYQNEWHQHGGQTNEAGWHSHELPATLWSNDAGGNRVPGNQDGYYNQNISGRWTSPNGNHVHTFTTAGSGGDEARPRNIGVSYYMRVL
ncbi:hypothetical protein G6M86_20925 [Agrobacterium tumefaciens]|uniref:Tail fiber protein n=1 Tax=Agrobacterium tumefaciens TaxID=358 RepID=A0AAJ4N5N1_AGRTU|nr:hypothetical protein G6M86_20925 [Agrobacterium tumefaciens]